MPVIEVGRLLRAGTIGFVVGCRSSRTETPSLGALVRVAVDRAYDIFGLVHEIRIDDDGLVRQLITADGVDEAIIADNRLNRNVPVEIGVLSVGYRLAGRIYHLLPPRPPFSLDKIYLCDPDELCQFTDAGRFGYFRHVLRAVELPVSELLASHLQQAAAAQRAAGNISWASAATQELITLLRDDYPTLGSVLGALSDTLIDF